MSDASTFWTTLDQLVVESTIVIDRPRGSAHPRYPDLIYPFDYGYLADTQGGDGDGIDLWRGSLPQVRVMGIVSTIDLLKRDAEIKLLISCTPTEMTAIHAFLNSSSQHGLLMVRPAPG